MRWALCLWRLEKSLELKSQGLFIKNHHSNILNNFLHNSLVKVISTLKTEGTMKKSDDVKKVDTTNVREVALRESNFIVYTFENLPSHYKILKNHFRKENETSDYPRSSMRTELYNSDINKTIIVKQFNYDWAAPAYSCPSLWENPKFKDKDLPTPYYITVNHKIAWVGHNYRNEKALAITLNRTTIEMCIKDENTIKPDNLIELSHHLTPLNLESQNELLFKSYAELSYARSNVVNMIHVPISFWQCALHKELKYQKAYIGNNLPKFIQTKTIMIPEQYKYNLDSVFSYFETESKEEQGRLEYIYSDPEDKDIHIRVITWPKNKIHTFNYPPNPDETQKFNHEHIQVKNKDIYLAYRNKDVGPFEAIWEGNNYNYLIISKSEDTTSYEWFIQFAGDIIGNNFFE
ncbi:hypothetical protein ACA351_08310 [Orientia tsutsugamushi]|uniref:hypothetical protein n=1 Tax=Orientia tsutsugamushi TaxID=784 RepID=UPI003528394F